MTPRLLVALSLPSLLLAPRARADVLPGRVELRRPPTADKTTAMPNRPPATRTVDAADSYFGVRVPDPYRWLEDEKSDEVQRWMREQDAFARARLAALPGRDALTARLRELYYVDSISAPIHRGTRWFYTRTHADKEKAIVYWREGEAGAERVLFDPNTWSADGSISLGHWEPSWDGRRVAYAVKANNSDEAELRLVEVESGKVSPVDTIPGAKYAWPKWTPAGDGFYYVRLPVDPAIPVADRPGHAEVRFHKVGEDPARDALIKGKRGDPREFVVVLLSRDGRFLFYVVSHGWASTEIWFQDRGDPRVKDPPWQPLVEGVPALYSVFAHSGRIYLLTNDGAPRYKVVVVDPAHPARAAWKTLVAEDPEAVLEDAAVVGGRLSLTWLRRAASELELRTLDGKPLRKVPLPGIGASSGLIGIPEDDEAYFSFTSFTQPQQIYKTSVRSGVTSLWAEVKVPFDPSPYTVEQVRYPSKDGTPVTMFVVHRKDAPRDGSTPYLLYGYGGFNINLQSEFSGGLVPWLEAGGGYAVPNLRGGGEYGEEWHRAGMLGRKQNTFDDFIAAAEYLEKSGFTRRDRLAIRGGSNGGLLVGAAMTQRPDLFRAVICQVPLLDMIRYTLFGSGKTWIDEYGSPEIEEQLRWLLSFSPYHHVKPKTAYPSLLMMSADSDDRVDPMHARKMSAALQAAQTADRPMLLRIERNAGHGGADLVKQAVESSADAWSFVMAELGVRPSAPSAATRATTAK